ncbi:MAG: PKD domain-containing protein [Thermoanaerobaculia bacterium]
MKKFSTVTGNGEGARAVTKTDAAGTVVAMADYDRNLRIESGNGILTGVPETLITSSHAASGGGYMAVTSDGTKFYAAETSSAMGGQTVIHRFAPATAGVAQGYYESGSTIVSNDMRVGGIRWGAGYLAVWGVDNGQWAVHLWNVASGAFDEIPLGAFIPNYYFAAPAGYAQPDGYTQNVTAVQPWSAGGVDYLMLADYGLGDVFQIQGGSSIEIAVDPGASRGTVNPNAPDGGTQIFPGDLVTFRSSTTASTPLQLGWNFGNPESGDDTATAMSGTPVSHRFVGMTTAAQIAAPKTVEAEYVADFSVNDSTTVLLAVPSPRIRLAGTAQFFTGSATADALFGDRWTDASDGVIEGHYDLWTVDGIATMASPDVTIPVGACGDHTLAFAAKYGAYTGSGTSVTPSGNSYAAPIKGVTCRVRPFTPAMSVSVSGSTVTFSDATRYSSTLFPNGANATLTWELKNASGTVTQNGAGSTFIVSPLPAGGSSVVLTVSVSDAVDDASCASMSTASVTYPIVVPDPSIGTSGCSTAQGPCTIAAVSKSGADQSAWTYEWTVSGITQPQTTQTVDAQKGGWFPAGGSYPVTVSVRDGATSLSGTTQVVLTVGSVCAGKPSGVSIAFSGSAGCSQGAPCAIGEVVAFTAKANGYAFQNCDSFTWNFGDGQTGTGASVTHQFTSSNTRTVTLTVSNSNGSATATTVVYISGTAIQPATNLGISTDVENPLVGQTITFTGRADSATAIQQWHWDFGDGTVGTGRTATHSFAVAKSYTVTLTVDNGTVSAPVGKSITVTAEKPFAFLLPVVAHLDGQNASHWRTDLFVYNPENSAIDLQFVYEGHTVTRAVTSTAIFDDLLGNVDLLTGV